MIARPGQRVFNWPAMPTILRSLFGPPTPTPPMQIDTSTLSGLSDAELRTTINELDQQRRLDRAAHQADIEPLLDERARLVREMARVDDRLSMAGIAYTDRERARDRDVQAVQAELHQRVVHDGTRAEDDADGVVDQRAVDRLVDQMLSGQRKRSDYIASTANDVEAQLAYDAAELEAIAWVRQVAQVRSATGRTPTMPESLERFDSELLKDIARRQGVSL